MPAAEALLAGAGIAALRRAPEELAVAAPSSLGGLFVFGPASAGWAQPGAARRSAAGR